MSLPKVLLHLGLPKTATSSLQHNVLQKLHEERRINFLGKCLNYDYMTKALEIVNYSGQFIRDAAEDKLSIDDARKQLAMVLEPNRLNVFSDEGLMVAYPGRENLPLSRKFEKLKAVFKGYDVQVVITLRDPVDYLYSLYVQLYPDFCSREKGVNSIEKYIECLISDPNNVLFESFFSSRWLPELQHMFEVTVLQYENILSKDLEAYQKWSEMLGVSSEEFRNLFDGKRINEKEKKGKEVSRVRDFRCVERVFRNSFLKNRILFGLAKWVYTFTGLKKLFTYRFYSSTMHRYPAGAKHEELQKLLLK